MRYVVTGAAGFIGSHLAESHGWQPRISLEDGISAQWSWASARVTAA